MIVSRNDAAQIAAKLLEQKVGVSCGLGCVSWDLGSGIFFWVSILGGGGGPLIGIALPKLSQEASALLSAAGLSPVVNLDWRCSPAIVMPLEVLSQRIQIARPKSIDTLHAVDAVLHGIEAVERSLLIEAQTLSSTLDLIRRLLPFGPTQSLVMPLGYLSVGNAQHAREYIREYLAVLASSKNGAGQEIAYRRYLSALHSKYQELEGG